MKTRNYLMSAFIVGKGICNLNQIEDEIINSNIKVSFHYSESENFNLPDGVISFNFRDDLDQADINILSNIVTNHDPRKIISNETQYDSRSNILVSLAPRSYQKVNFISQDFTDKSTWIKKSIRVNNVSMIQSSSNNLVWELPTPEQLINVRYGKISDEDWWIHYYKNLKQPSLDLTVTLKVNNTELIESTLDNPNGDYLVNYLTGSITLNNLIDNTSEVKISYAKPTIFEMTIFPNPNSVLFIEACECQFSKDINVKDTVMFEVWGEKGKDPKLDQVPVPNGTLIRMGWKEYKTMLDYINESDKAYKVFACENPQQRDLSCDGYVYAWDYKSSIELNSNYGNFLKVVLKNNLPFLGSYCTSTFYGTSQKL